MTERRSSVDWAKAFYARQAELGDLYGLPLDIDAVSDWHQRRARTVERLAGPGALRILELGAGTGDTAAVLVSRGHAVTAVEIVDGLAERARAWAERIGGGRLTVVCGDFHQIDLRERFDVVCYFDGFGTGDDPEQRRLLGRIAGWLTASGCALIDVFNPQYWAARAGTEYRWAHAAGRYEFDAEDCRAIDRMWPARESEVRALMQTLRCYSPPDLRLLLEGTGLRLDGIEPYASEQYERRVPLDEAMLYLAQIGRDSAAGSTKPMVAHRPAYSVPR